MIEPTTQSKGHARSEPLLDVVGLTKRFTGTLALDNIDFGVRRGEVHALLGQNGAGKSTLIKILGAVYQAEAGEIRFRDRPVHPGIDPLPIAFIHQDLGFVDWMSVAENVAVQTGYPRGRLGLGVVAEYSPGGDRCVERDGQRKSVRTCGYRRSRA